MKLTHREIEKKLVELTQQFLYESGLGKRKVNLDNSLQLHLGLSSLARLELFMEIEKQFDIQFKDQTLGEINTLRDVSKVLFEWMPQKIEKTYSVPKFEEHQVQVEKAETLVDVLLLYAEQCPDRKHVFYQEESCNEVIITYGDLLNQALRVAQSLLDRGVKPGDRIAMMLPSQPSFLYTFFGILLVNCIPVPIYPLLRHEIYKKFAEQESLTLKDAAVSLLVTFSEIKPFNKLMLSLVPTLKEVVTANVLLTNNQEGLSMQPKANDIALIQYTSGKSRDRKGVLLTHQNLLSKIRAFGKALELTKKDIIVNWTPLYRNLGLIGMWLGSFYYGIPLILISPFMLLNRPERWLWTLHYSNATISGGDNFAYDLCIRKISPAQIEGLDLSSWRLAINFGEVIKPSTIEKFYHKFAPYGFKRESFVSIYGLTESSTCVKPEPFEKYREAIRADEPEELVPFIYETVILEEKLKEQSSSSILQKIKNYVGFPVKRMFHYLGKLGKLIYTIYVILLLLITVPPVYFSLWIIPDNVYAKLLHYWARMMFLLMFCPIKVYNKQELYKYPKSIFVANHASYFDTILFMAVLPPQTKIVAKQDLATTPIIGAVIRKLGHILVNRADFPIGIKKSLEKIEKAAEEHSVLIFPEGTFSYAAGIRPFKLGAFKIACEKDIPLLPIASQGTRRLLRNGDFLIKPTLLKVIVGNHLIPPGKEYQDFIRLRKEARKHIVENCGEPSLELIMGGKAFAELSPESENF